MSVYEVSRQVDTVTIKMDESVAQMLAVVLNSVVDETGLSNYSGNVDGSPFQQILAGLALEDINPARASRRYKVKHYVGSVLVIEDAI